jgi:predicted RNA-binding Zn ribbon-like protein
MFEFIADRPALDFVATVAERGTTDDDYLHSAADLRAWIRESALVDDITVSPAEFIRAIETREAMFGMLAALLDGRRPAPHDRALVNAAAARPGPRAELAGGRVRRTGDVDAVLAVLATDVIDLHDSPDRDLLKWCADDKCTRPYVDRSRGGRRRWCGMRGCGDRAKAAAYRARQRHHP